MSKEIIKIEVEEIPEIIKQMQKIFSIHFLKKNGEERTILTRNDMVKIKKTIKGVSPTSEEVKKQMLTMQDLSILMKLQKEGEDIKNPKIIAKTWRRAIYNRIQKIVGNNKEYIVINSIKKEEEEWRKNQ